MSIDFDRLIREKIPVKLQCGKKAYISQKIDKGFLGYIVDSHNNPTYAILWNNNGESKILGASILGIWHLIEERPKYKAELPRPLDRVINGDLVYKLNLGKPSSLITYDSSIHYQDLINGLLFDKAKDAQAWLNALIEAKTVSKDEH